MMRAENPDCSRFGSLPLALVLTRSAFRPRWLVTKHSSLVPGSGDEPGSRCTVHARYRDTTHCISNRNACEIKNRRNWLTTKDITFSNRNKKPVFANAEFRDPKPQSTDPGDTIASGAHERDNHILLTPRIQGASKYYGHSPCLTNTQPRRSFPDH